MRWVRFGLPVLGLVAIAAGFGRDARGRALPTATVASITVTARDFEFDAPATVPAGLVNIRMINAGKELHHAVLVRMDQGKGSRDLGEALAKNEVPAWATFVGGPNAVDPGTESNASVVLRPGHYAWICMIPDTARMPHMAKGMIKEFDVVAGGTGTLPTPDVAMQLTDYEFKLTKPFAKGRQVVRARNNAAQPHDAQMFKLATGQTRKDLEEWLRTEAGPPPASGIGGIAPMAQGQANNLTVDLTPGDYVLVCFIPDTKDGKPHFAHGMVMEFSIK